MTLEQNLLCARLNACVRTQTAYKICQEFLRFNETNEYLLHGDNGSDACTKL